MDKIRIGNDIKLSVHLSTSTYDPINIHSVKAYLINTTLQSKLEEQIKAAYKEYDDYINSDKIKYVSRFPLEPMPDEYCCNKYDICQCSIPTYKANPLRYKNVYSGFGVCPHTFDGFKFGMYSKNFPNESKIKKAEDEYMKEKDFIKYQAHVESSDRINNVYVYFPSEDQINPGIYKLIIVAQVYQPGYSKFDNLKTITVDYNDIFQLVDDSTGISGDGQDIVIEVGVVETQNGTFDPTQQDLYVSKGEYSGNIIQLTLSDGTHLAGNIIDVSPITDWYEDDL